VAVLDRYRACYHASCWQHFGEIPKELTNARGDGSDDMVEQLDKLTIASYASRLQLDRLVCMAAHTKAMYSSPEKLMTEFLHSYNHSGVIELLSQHFVEA
jgi:hypothetical protein